MNIEYRYLTDGRRDLWSRADEELGDEGGDIVRGVEYHDDEAQEELWEKITDDLLQLKEDGASVEVVSDYLAECDDHVMTRTVLRDYVTTTQDLILLSAIDDSDFDGLSNFDGWEPPKTNEGWYSHFDLIAWEIVHRPPEDWFSGGPFPVMSGC